MNLELLIRAYDGFTSDLLKFAFMNKSLKVRIDGPYGGSHARDVVEEKSQSILIAGGSGIAVIWPIVHFLLSRYPGQKADTEAASRGKGAGRITFIWVVQQRAQLSWLSERDIEEIKSMGAEVIIPPPTQEAGRPDLQSLIRERVEENVEGSTGVVGSGPDSMGRQVRNTCAELIGEGRDVEVLIEKFGW